MPYTPSVHVEFAFGYDALEDTTDGSFVDIAAAHPNDIVIDDITITRGRSSEFDEFPPGVATVRIKDRARILDPTNTSSTYNGQLIPRVPMRIRGKIGSTYYPRFYGYVDGWPVQTGRGQNTVELVANDAFKILARATLPTSVYDYEVLSDDPQAYYKLGEETGERAVDYSPTRADGAYLSGPNTLRGQPSVVPYGADGSIETFGANYEGVVVADENAKVGSDTTGNMTIEMWLSSNGTLGNGRQDLMRQGTGGTYGVGWNLILFPETYNDLLSDTTWLYQQHCDVLALGLISTPVVYYWRVEGFTDEGTIQHIVVDVEVAGGAVVGPHPDGTGMLHWNGAFKEIDLTDDDVQAFDAPEIFIGAGALVLENASFAGRIDNVALYRSCLSHSARWDDHYEAGMAPWDNDLPGTRIGRVLDILGWSATLRDLDTGEMVLGPAVLGARNALEYLQEVAASEQGRLFMGRDGSVVFHARDRFLTEATESTSQYTFADVPADGDAVPSAFTLTLDERFIYNRADVTREGGDTVTIDDTSSQATYGPVTRSLSGLQLRDDRQSRMLADYIVFRYSTPEVRAEDFKINPELDADDWAAVFALEIGYRVTIETKPLNTGSQVSKDLHLEYINEHITPSAWEFTFKGAPVDPNAAAYFVWGGDGATQGWGVGIWR